MQAFARGLRAGPLALCPVRGPAALAALEARTVPTAEAARALRGQGGPSSAEGGRVALVRVAGVLTLRGTGLGAELDELLGVGNYAAVGAAVDRAAADPEVDAIALLVDSPGGDVTGATELAARLRAARDRKPLVAYVEGFGASAAYWLASQASRIVVAPSGQVGSIGIIALHADLSAALASEGIKLSAIYAGEKKADGSPYAPLSERARADLQADVNAVYETFLRDVGAGRGSKLSAAAAKATEAGLYRGALAVKAGLADATGTLADALRDLPRRGRAGAAAPAARSTKPAPAPPAPKKAEPLERPRLFPAFTRSESVRGAAPVGGGMAAAVSKAADDKASEKAKASAAYVAGQLRASGWTVELSADGTQIAKKTPPAPREHVGLGEVARRSLGF